ncbi:MAG: RNA methyltransferase [Saprospiraceae bacterium]
MVHKVELPAAFVQRMQKTLSTDDFNSFETSLDLTPPVSIHLHNSKPSHYKNIKDSLDAVPWCERGVYIPERPLFTIDPGFQSGGYYVQEASSMLIEAAMQIALKEFPYPSMLDLCASPGGKSALVLSILNGNGLLISNETIQSRVDPLVHNLIKWGYPNQVITSIDPARLVSLPAFFDIILVDAPCSGEGLFRKDTQSRKEWNEHQVGECVLRQQRILMQAIDALAPGGFLIYSTCTYNPSENIDQVISLKDHGFNSVEMPALHHLGLEVQSKQGCTGYQSYPNKIKGEGFFITLLQKQDIGMKMDYSSNGLEWVNTPEFVKEFIENDLLSCFIHQNSYFMFPAKYQHDLEIISRACRIIQAGIPCGSFKQKDFIPHHGLSQSILLKKEIPTIQLSEKAALEYLKRNALPNDINAKGFNLASIDNQVLGWVKGVPGRLNNLLPLSYRIRGNFN